MNYMVLSYVLRGKAPKYFSKYRKYITPWFCILNKFDDRIINLKNSLFFENLFTTPVALIGH